jgi:site-specific DNA-cytosine methylase
MTLKVLGICGGNGVILHPFKNHLIANIEPRTVFHTTNQEQWNLNFSSPFDETSNVKYRRDSVEVIIGAPDCGHSSILSYSRSKKLHDPTLNDSLRIYIEGIEYYQPKIFMMENLPNLLDTYPDLLGQFPNYRFKIFKESVSAWGNSQITRIRLIIIGIRKDLPGRVDDNFKLPAKVELKTSGQLIKGLEELNPAICHVRESDDKMICLYYKDQRRISVKEARRIWLTDFKTEKRWAVNQGALTTQPGVYRNFADDYPLTVRKQNRQFNHWGFMLSPREMARIQGVPDSFKLWYNEDRHEYAINKARTTVTKTPPYEIGVWFKNILLKL